MDEGGPEAPVDAGELGAHLDAELEVEVRQRLVHEERAGAAHQRTRQGDTLHLTARQLRRTALQQTFDVQQARDPLDLGGDLARGTAACPQR
jgi:hypothetical protein